MELIAIVTVLVSFEYMVFSILVGKARGKYGVSAPSIIGDPAFERSFRVQQNTLEQLIIFYPALWIFGYYVQAEAGAVLGMIFLIGRIMYARGYVQSPDKRGPGFIVGSLSLAILLVGDLLMLGIRLI